MNPQEKPLKELTFHDLAHMARNEAEAFATHIIGEAPTYRNGREVRYYDKQSLVVFISGSKQGRFKSFSDSEVRGDLFDLWRYIRGGTPHDAVMGYKAFAGLVTAPASQVVKMNVGPTPEEIQRQEAIDLQKRRSAAQKIWGASSKADGKKEALEYFAGRAITAIPENDVVRYRTVPKDELERLGVPADQLDQPHVAIVLKATDQNNYVSAVQQILTTNGRKANITRPKWTRGSLVGSSVKLGDDSVGETLVISEGPETGLSVHQATAHPTYITLGTSNYTNITIPPNIRRLIIACDIEPSGAGLTAALKAAQFWLRHGIQEVGIALPRLADGDFNDVAQQSGDEAVKAAFDKAFYPEHIRNDDVLLVATCPRVAFHAFIRTGVASVARAPRVNKETGLHVPVNVDNILESHHKQLILIGQAADAFDVEYLNKTRPDVSVTICSQTTVEFLQASSDPDFVKRFVQNAADLYSPKPIEDAETVHICLRRKDADAIASIGKYAIAVRHSEITQIDFDILQGKSIVVCPLGAITPQDKALYEHIRSFGLHAEVIFWQLFAPQKDGYKIIRESIPRLYGASDAIEDGWSGDQFDTLCAISKANFESARTLFLKADEC